jgi:membrane-associated phospholipid phosphatase
VQRKAKKLHKCAAVIFSTVYLRFHSVIDSAAGVVFAGITLLLGSTIRA